jgi:hypothetical protein
MPDLRFSDGLIAFCTLLGPILAVQAQKFVERATERRRRKQWIFDVLMATRATRINPDHVRALNQIELEFSGANWFGKQFAPNRKERTVLENWRTHADNLNRDLPKEQGPERVLWFERVDNSFIALLQSIGRAMGHNIDQRELRRGVYYPTGFSDDELRNHAIQVNFLRLLMGEIPLKMEVTSIPYNEEAVKQQMELHAKLISAVAGGAVSVEIKGDASRTPPQSPFVRPSE